MAATSIPAAHETGIAHGRTANKDGLITCYSMVHSKLAIALGVRPYPSPRLDLHSQLPSAFRPLSVRRSLLSHELG